MDIQAEKLNIIKWLAGIQESKVIKQFILLKKSSEEFPSKKLSQAEKLAIDKGLHAIKDGRIKSHEEVMKITRKKYTQLFK
jgi:predicted transcriptional regulator